MAYYRSKGPYAQSSLAAWSRMFEWLRASGMIRATGSGYGLLLDDPRSVDASECRYDACVELISGYAEKLPGDIGMRRLPGGAYVRCRHTTGADGLGRAISQLRDEWMPTRGLIIDPRRPVIEVYLDDPAEVAWDKRRIDLCVPVKAIDEVGRSAA